jgi:hypothetical protein
MISALAKEIKREKGEKIRTAATSEYPIKNPPVLLALTTRFIELIIGAKKT